MPSRFVLRLLVLTCLTLLGGVARAQSAPQLAELRAEIQALLSRFVDVTGAKVSELDAGMDGADVVASGRVEAFGHSAKLRVKLVDKSKPRELALEFGGVRLGLARIAKLGGGFADLLPKGLGLEAGVLLHEITLTRDVEAKKLESIALSFAPEATTSWQPLRGLPIRLEGLRIGVTVMHPQASKQRQVRGSIGGTLRAGVKFACGAKAKLTRNPDDFELEAQLANKWRLVDIASALGGDKVAATLRPLPDILENTALRDATLALKPKTKLASLTAQSNFGRLELVARERGVMVGIAPPPDFKLAKLDASLRSLDASNLDLSKLSFVISSFDGDVDSAIAGRVGGGRVGKGLNLAAKLDLRPLKLDRTLGLRQLDLRARIPYPNPMNLVLSAAIEAQIALGGGATFKEVQFVLRPSPQRFKLALQGRMDLRVQRQTLGLLGEMAVEPLTQTVSGTFALDPKNGEWRDPFGVRGVGVPKLAVSLGATFGTGIPLPTLGLQAGLRVGEGRNAIKGNGVVVLNPRDPMNSMIAFDLRQLSLMRILGLTAPRTAASIQRSPLARALAAVQVRNLAARIVPNDIDFAGSTFEKGYRIAGDFNVLGVNAKGLFELDYSRGLSVLATMDAIRLANGNLVISGARGRRNPVLKLDLRSDRQAMLVSGKLSVLRNFFVSETDLRITPQRQELYARGKIFGKLQAELVASAATSIANRRADFYLRARMEQSLLADLRKRVLSEIDKATRKHVRQINKAKGDVAKAQRDVQHWDRQIAATRRRVKARQDRDIAKMRAAANTARRNADREYKRLGSKISSLKKRIKKQPWRAADLGAEIAVLETRRNAQRLLMKTIGANLVKGLANLGKKFPKELSSELGPMLAAQKTAQGTLIAAQGVLSGYRGVVTGTMGAAKWIAANGLGGAFDLNAMQLETRLSTARGSWFACSFRGQFLKKNFATALRLDLNNPARMASDIAKALLDGRAPKRAFRAVSIARRNPSRLAPPRPMPALSANDILSKCASGKATTRGRGRATGRANSGTNRGRLNAGRTNPGQPTRGRSHNGGQSRPIRIPVGKPRSKGQPIRIPVGKPRAKPRPVRIPVGKPKAPVLAVGRWQDSNGMHINLSLRGRVVQALMVSAGGKRWWTRGSGTLDGKTIRAMTHYRGRARSDVQNGRISANGRSITWGNRTRWTFVGAGAWRR